MKPTLFPIPLVMLVSSVFADPGDFDDSFGTSGSGAGNTVFAVTVQPDGKILAAGSLQSVNDDAGTVLRKHLVSFNANGSVDRGFGANDKGTNGPVYCLAVQTDGKILVGGDFTSVSDASGDYGRNHVARFNADGSVDTGFGSEGHGASGAVRALVALPDGKILVAGDFTSLTDPSGTVARHRIARLDGDGSIDATFGADGKGFDDIVVSIAVQADGKIVAGGNFLNVDDANGSHSRRRFARLQSDGSVDSDFGSPDKGVLFGENVRNVLIQADGKILIAGGFSFIEDSVATHTRRCIARLNSDGSVDTGFGSHDNGVVGFVYGLSQQADGKILAAGQFTSVRDSEGTYGRLRVARFNPDGSVDTGFGSEGLGANLDVYAVALQPDGGVIVGGAFTGISDPVNAAHSRRRIARLENGAATSELSVPSRSVIQWSRGGSSPEATAVRFDFSLDEGVSWIPLGDGVRTEGGWTLPTNLNGSGQVRGSATIHAGGSEHGGMGLVREVVDFEFFNPPSVTILGSKKIRTTRKKSSSEARQLIPTGIWSR